MFGLSSLVWIILTVTVTVIVTVVDIRNPSFQAGQLHKDRKQRAADQQKDAVVKEVVRDDMVLPFVIYP